jgi:hypothetical protein
MLIRLLIVCVAVMLVSLLLQLHRRFQAAPLWLRIVHHITFGAALAYTVIFAGTFIALHLFGYQL